MASNVWVEDSSCNAWALTLFLAWRVWVLKLEWGDSKINVSCNLEFCLRPIHLFPSQNDKHSNIQNDIDMTLKMTYKWQTFKTHLAKTWILWKHFESAGYLSVTCSFPHLLQFHLQLLAPFWHREWSCIFFSTYTSWWFQPIWNILIKLDHLPRYGWT